MAQKTNLNVSPYFDDFSEPNIGAKDKNYYKVLFNPGKPIQARELNTIQSILQNQLESFGSNIFKEGSIVVPGNVVYDNQFFAVKLNPTQFGVNINLYLNSLLNKTIEGQVSGVSATVQFIQFPNSQVNDTTIYVKYINSNSDYEISSFVDGESLTVTENITYGSTTINVGTPVATLISSEATFTGSATSIGEGILFVRGTFVRIPKQTIILDYYTNTPSYRVGLLVDEQIITAKDDPTLYDNAKGFSNYAAPGADRFKISLSLSKKLLTDVENDTNFVEILRVKNGAIQKVENKTQYSLIKDYLAQRTYDESGNYVVDPFEFSLNNSLNNRLGNDGIYLENEKTDQGNTPSDDLLCIKFSPGKAYVKGYDIEKNGIEIVDVQKPRTTQTISNVNVPFEMGNIIRVNNVSGGPKQKTSIELYNQRKNSTTAAAGIKIGDARVYSFSLTDSSYQNQSTGWDLYLYDIQTYTQITLNQTISSAQLPQTSYVKGKSSGASGYAVSAGSGDDIIFLRQTSGSFLVGEQIIINGIELQKRSIRSVRSYGSSDIKSVFQSTSVSGLSTAFIADTQLDKEIPFGFSPTDIVSIDGSTLTSPGKTFSGISSDTIIRYQRVGFLTETYNRIVSISNDGRSATLSSVPNVSGVCDGSIPGSLTNTTFSLGVPKIVNEDQGFLYAELPDQNIASVNLSDSILTFNTQSNTTLTPTSGSLVVSTNNFNLGISSQISRFETFDEERYSIHYADGEIERLTSDKVSLSVVNNQITFNNIQNKNISLINATFVKTGIKNKIKQYSRSLVVTIDYSKFPESGISEGTSLNDGLVYNQFYGLRVQDEEICLRYPDVSKVIAVYESLDNSSPSLDQLLFDSFSNVDTNTIIGENIIGSDSGSVARLVTKLGSNIVGIVYLNGSKFLPGEVVTFSESNIVSAITSIINGSYKNITTKFSLDKGQKDQYYDYSKIVRKSGAESPSKKLLVIFDLYTIQNNDNGDLFTANSYDGERFSEDVPSIGRDFIRASDTLDFRPRVAPLTTFTSSPFDFSSRNFGSEPNIILSSNESSFVGYNFYVGRIDKICLDKLGNFNVLQGVPSIDPKEPIKSDDVMEVATISLPPYLYNISNASISLVDNRRYTMRDIGRLQDRLENLEKVTTLTLLEINTETLQIQDAQGFNRFRSGFFVDDFSTSERINFDFSSVDVDTENRELLPIVTRNSLELIPTPADNVIDEEIDLTANYSLLDNNTQKTNDVITLKYTSVDWIEQPLATKVENINPFNVVSYNGIIKLSPSEDSWVRTIRLEDINITRNVNAAVPPNRRQAFINQNNAEAITITRRGRRRFFGLFGRRRRRTVIVGARTISTTDNLISAGDEQFMRSRNIGFYSSNLKPLTRFYQFLDGNSSIDFIPKLIEISPTSSLENYGASSTFLVGETVYGSFNNKRLIRFRLSTPNHKEGSYNNPSRTYNINPYLIQENIPGQYSSSSKILNIDIDSLSLEPQGLYYGYLVKGMKLVGKTSGAVAYVKNLRLISDNFGDLLGSFFLRDPLTSPPPPVRITTGTKIYNLSSSLTNEIPLPGSRLVSSAESIYKSEGRWEQRQRITTTTITNFYDPLAQSFSVGGIVEAPTSGLVSDEDNNGAYLTAVDLFFANKDSNNASVTVEIRTVELGTPTRTVIGNPVVLRSDQINISTDASIPTKVTFDYPIYLEPAKEYAIVLLSPQSDQYEVWIAEMGEKTVNTSSLPDASNVRYTKQFAIGSLFLSQNGSIWTANQYQDLKFKLYKAKFASSGSVFFQNPTLTEGNGYVNTLSNNPITILPKKVSIGINTITNAALVGILTTGRKISESSKPYNYGFIVGTGSSVSTISITSGGENYSDTTAVDTYPITGDGRGLKLNITTTNGLITSTSITPGFEGNGYSVGDVVGIVTSSVSSSSGDNARITISQIANSGVSIDTLYLTNVQAQAFTANGTSNLVYYDNSNARISLAGTTITSYIPDGGVNSGNYLLVNHFEHGMYSPTNKLRMSDVLTDVPPTILTEPVLSSSTTVSVASTINFGTFEGSDVSSSNPGYIKIEDEIIKYESVSSSGRLETVTRGVNSTIILDHDIDSEVYKYEIGGVSLLRINKTHDISDLGIEIDRYYIEFDRDDFDSNVEDRSSDGSLSNTPELSFNTESTSGGNEVKVTKNIQYNSIIPHIALISPDSSTSVSAQIRTVSGTSVGGNESSFLDQGYEDVELGEANDLSSVRIVCSEENEDEYLDGLFRNKSFIAKINLTSSNQNLSPMIFWKQTSVELLGNRLNNPKMDYINDSRVKSLTNDPHSTIYVSNTVNLLQPATSLKVFVAAFRPFSSDFRVLYSLVRPDSSEVEQSFELFPGYSNLTGDFNQDGYPDVIDSSKNSGLPDTFVPESLNNQFLDYEYTASNLGEFVGYTIKIVMSGSDQSRYPIFKDIRSIAIR
jgi:hypothetical protein